MRLKDTMIKGMVSRLPFGKPNDLLVLYIKFLISKLVSLGSVINESSGHLLLILKKENMVYFNYQ